MKLGILDQAPISSNQTAQDALYESMKLAQAGETFGYTRYWIAEHHGLPGLASSAPEVMLSYIASHTTKIRIGAGAILLPYYRPFKIAEVFNTLETLFPNRIDLGIGRAPGGSAEVTNALSNNFLQQVWNLPTSVKELLQFLHQYPPNSHSNSKPIPLPTPHYSPKVWMLGTSEKSALLAADLGLSYAFGQFMSENDGAAIFQKYKASFQPNKHTQNAQVILTVSVICAETSEKAEQLALSPLLWSLQKEKGEGHQGVPSLEEAKEYEYTDKEKASIEKMKRNTIIGDPQQVKQQLHELESKYDVDEIMLVTITHSPEDRIQSYKLIAKEMQLI